MNRIRWGVLSTALLALLVMDRLGASGAEPAPDPVLWRQVTIPEALLRTIVNRAGETVRFGGDIRLGDLNNDGKADLLVYRSVDGGMKPVFFGAFTLEGETLWQV